MSNGDDDNKERVKPDILDSITLREIADRLGGIQDTMVEQHEETMPLGELPKMQRSISGQTIIDIELDLGTLMRLKFINDGPDDLFYNLDHKPFVRTEIPIRAGESETIDMKRRQIKRIFMATLDTTTRCDVRFFGLR